LRTLPDVGRSERPAGGAPAGLRVGIEEPAVFLRRAETVCAVMVTSSAAEELVGRDLGGLAARGMLRVGEFSRRVGEVERMVRGW
jgi:hypothetical protein